MYIIIPNGKWLDENLVRHTNDFINIGFCVVCCCCCIYIQIASINNLLLKWNGIVYYICFAILRDGM